MIYKKYDWIVKILIGEEFFIVDNFKFRFWVKVKGFCLGFFVNKDGCDCMIYVFIKYVVRFFIL